MGLKLVSFLWGLAEATLFFIVPDVGLSVIGKDKLSNGIRACVYALIGAILGGILMYGWGRLHAVSAFRLLEHLPGISRSLIDNVQISMDTSGVQAILRAPLNGTPYKLLALEAGHIGTPIIPFILITIPARFLRFTVVTVVTHYALKLIPEHKKARTRLIALGSGWLIFYLLYFIWMGW